LENATDLVKATRIPDENQVKMAKIQLKDVARMWWLAEVARLKKPITWDSSRRISMKRFFSVIAQNKMKERFIEL